MANMLVYCFIHTTQGFEDMHVHINEHFNMHYIVLKGVENLIENNDDIFLELNHMWRLSQIDLRMS